jgi:hypothetical protein
MRTYDPSRSSVTSFFCLADLLQVKRFGQVAIHNQARYEGNEDCYEVRPHKLRLREGDWKIDCKFN